jgi:hypothetical protein
VGDSPQVLRDLSISLERVGDQEWQALRGEAALAAYRDGRELRQKSRFELDDSPPALEDLATSLERLATDEALSAKTRREAVAEALVLRVRLVVAHPHSDWHGQCLQAALRVAADLAAQSLPDNA